ncbi:MAG: hypothetical protein GY711_26265 [bacterium]|nr:hypothetical protein [bacterium]
MLLASILAALLTVHPEDGPDIDLRIGIESDAVHVGMTMNIAFVWELVEFDWERPPRFTEKEQAALRDKLVEYYRGVNGVRVDGVEVAPVLADFAIIELEHPGGEDQGPRGVLSTVGVRLGLDYSLKTDPARVELTWGAYVPDFDNATPDDVPIKDTPCQVTALGASFLHVFTQDEPTLDWRAPSVSRTDRFLAVPQLGSATGSAFGAWTLFAVAAVVAAALAIPRKRRAAYAGLAVVLGVCASVAYRMESGSVELDEDGARTTFQPLHANIYRAFDYARESDIYDALAHSVRGDLLDVLYAEIYAGLVMQEQGGAVSRVQAVRPLEIDVLEVGRFLGDDLPGFRVDARWQVDGLVFHWGHSHNRTNEYRAVYTVVAGDEGWRIAAAETIEQMRIELPGGASGEVEVTRELLEAEGVPQR